MKAGLVIGYKDTVDFIVTEKMVAQFEGNVIHPVFSTVSMVYYMEWVSRKVLLPYLEENEEGMGAAVQVKHIAPSVVGSHVVAEAVVTEVTDCHIITAVTLCNENGVIGKGEVKQVILLKEE